MKLVLNLVQMVFELLVIMVLLGNFSNQWELQLQQSLRTSRKWQRGYTLSCVRHHGHRHTGSREQPWKTSFRVKEPIGVFRLSTQAAKEGSSWKAEKVSWPKYSESKYLEMKHSEQKQNVGASTKLLSWSAEGTRENPPGQNTLQNDSLDLIMF